MQYNVFRFFFQTARKGDAAMPTIVVTQYTIVRVVPDEDGEVISVVIEDETGPLVAFFAPSSPDRPMTGCEYQFRRVAAEQQKCVTESVRVNRLLEIALAAAVKKPLVSADMDDPRHILGVDAGFYPYLL